MAYGRSKGGSIGGKGGGGFKLQSDMKLDKGKGKAKSMARKKV